MSPLDYLTNLKEAQEFLESIEKEADRIILDTARYKVVQRLVNLGHQPQMFPVKPFDMLFYLVVVNDLIQHKRFLKDMLDGNVEAADTF